jgi:hypothetical protein
LQLQILPISKDNTQIHAESATNREFFNGILRLRNTSPVEHTCNAIYRGGKHKAIHWAEQAILGANGSAMRFLTIYKVVLGPVLLAQGRRIRRTALRLAEAAGERSGFVVIESALPELKLLFVGTPPWLAWALGISPLPWHLRSPLSSQIDLSDPFGGNCWPSQV